MKLFAILFSRMRPAIETALASRPLRPGLEAKTAHAQSREIKTFAD